MLPTRAALTVLIACALAAPGLAAPKKLWELGGLNKPESVVRDPNANVLYVSNMNGKPDEKDGNGFLSKVSADGKMIEAEWVKGLNAPKGLALFMGTLYVADIDELLAVDVAKGAVVKQYPAKGAKFLNDVAVALDGRVFVSDMRTNTIWSLDKDKLEPWLSDAKLNSPNGLLVQGDKLVVGAFGKGAEGGAPAAPGHLLEASLADKSIRDLGDGSPAGHIDGIEPFDGGSYLVTDWINGALLRIDVKGSSEQLIDFSQGSADHAYVPETRTALIPLMLDNKLVAYRME